MRNNGVEILRMILCFWVVLFHLLGGSQYSDSKIIAHFSKKMYHVPSFFFISFYFLFPIIKTKNITKMKLRLERLLIPYLGWPIITWTFNYLGHILLKKTLFGDFIPLVKLKKQLIIGRIFLVQFWFLFNLLIFTIFFFIITLVLNTKDFLKFNQFFAIISYILQYSKYNYYFFDKFKGCVSHSVGHFVESFPIAITAFMLNYCRFLSNYKDRRNIIIFYCFIFKFFIYYFSIFAKIEIYGQRYNYNGIDKNIYAILSFIGFFLIPFEKCYSKQLIIFIKIITKYTQGIYCIHPIVILYAVKYFNLKKTFKGCIIIYLLSYLSSFFGEKISFNTKIKFLFI